VVTKRALVAAVMTGQRRTTKMKRRKTTNSARWMISMLNLTVFTTTRVRNLSMARLPPSHGQTIEFHHPSRLVVAENSLQTHQANQAKVDVLVHLLVQRMAVLKISLQLLQANQVKVDVLIPHPVQLTAVLKISLLILFQILIHHPSQGQHVLRQTGGSEAVPSQTMDLMRNASKMVVFSADSQNLRSTDVGYCRGVSADGLRFIVLTIFSSG
jgi:hypothetical protein